MKTTVIILSLLSAFGAVKPVSPPGMTPAGPYTPGILTDNFLYVSGQGAKDAAGQIPAAREDQLRNALDNVASVVRAAGLTLNHVVYVQVFLTGDPDEAPLDAVFRKYFPQAPPARSVIGVAGLPGTPVEISAVAVRDLSRKKIVAPPGYSSIAAFSAGVIAADRLYVSGLPGADPQNGKIPGNPDAEVRFALQAVERITKAAGIGLAHMVFVNPYLTSKIPMNVMNRIYAGHFEFGATPARATIQVSALPGGASIHFTGVAVMDLSRRKPVRPKNMEPSPTASPCVLAGDACFCSAKSGFIPGPRGGIYASTVETQLRQTMRNLLDGLEEAGFSLANVVASNVYLDDIAEFPRFNPIYAEYFNPPFPARTTVQQFKPGDRTPSARGVYPTLEQISIIAVR